MPPVSISLQARREQSYWSPCQSTLSMVSPENIQNFDQKHQLKEDYAGIYLWKSQRNSFKEEILSC